MPPTDLARVTAPAHAPTTPRVARRRHYVMCAPTYFEVAYAINPWMRPDVPVDHTLAVQQWNALRETYEQLGHRVDLLEPVEGLPDMVFAANGALVVDGRAFGASFTFPQRRPEARLHREGLPHSGVGPVREPAHVNEGEGDFAVVGTTILAGTGFRTSTAAHQEAQEFFGRPVISLQLVDPRFYHLDTALAVLDDTTIAYHPAAFSPGSLGVLRTLFPDAIEADESDALVFGLNAVSDGRHVVLPQEAVGLTRSLRDRGFEPVGVATSELLKAGGSVKCCTLEIRA